MPANSLVGVVTRWVFFDGEYPMFATQSAIMNDRSEAKSLKNSNEIVRERDSANSIAIKIMSPAALLSRLGAIWRMEKDC